jgi:long-subunit acyl-CoA synthetase (AMP-forming)
MLVLAIVGCGGIYTGTNPSYTPHELAHHFRASETHFVLSEPEILTAVRTATKEVGIPDSNVRIFDTQGQRLDPGQVSWKEMFNFGEEDWITFQDGQLSKSTCAARLFSSGTTGLPKAVTITHQNLIAQNMSVFEMNPRPYEVSFPALLHYSISPVRPIFHLKKVPC